MKAQWNLVNVLVIFNWAGAEMLLCYHYPFAFPADMLLLSIRVVLSKLD